MAEAVEDAYAITPVQPVPHLAERHVSEEICAPAGPFSPVFSGVAGGQEITFRVGSDTWEWNLREYDVHFLFACYALGLTARLWNEHVECRGVNDTYVLVREDRVQNRPAQPVIDVSVLDHRAPDTSMAADALDARERIMAVPRAREELRVTVHELTELVREHGDESARARLNRAIDREMAASERALDHREIRAYWAAARAEREERARPAS